MPVLDPIRPKKNKDNLLVIIIQIIIQFYTANTYVHKLNNDLMASFYTKTSHNRTEFNSVMVCPENRNVSGSLPSFVCRVDIVIWRQP